MPSFYIKNIRAFLDADEKSILSDLATGITSLNFELIEETLNSWKEAVKQLRPCLRSIVSKNPAASDWSILLEYVIPMINQRIDCVIIAGDIIFVIEFKGGESTSGAQALRQAQEYTMNLEDFHEAQGVSRAALDDRTGSRWDITKNQEQIRAQDRHALQRLIDEVQQHCITVAIRCA
jgi:hypothetical protein